MQPLSTIFSRFRNARRFASVSTAFVFAAIFVVFATSWEERAATAADANADVLSPIAPFVDAKTLCVARVNLADVDFDRLSETFDEVFAQFLTNAGVSKESIDASRTEFAKTLDALEKTARESLDDFRTTSGLKEAFFVVQNAQGDGFAVVVPVDGLTSEQTDAMKAIVEETDWNCAIYKKRFLVASPFSLKEIGACYKSFVPGRNADRDKFFAENRDKLAALYCVSFRIRTALDAATRGEARTLLARVPQSYRAALEVFDSSIGDIRAVVDAGTVAARVEFRFKSAVASGQMRGGLEKIVDAVVDAQFGDALKKSAATVAFSGFGLSDEQVERFNLVPLAREACRGALRAQLPRQEGERLVFDFSLVDSMKKNGNGVALVGVGVGLLLPAVQAARAKAVQLQNANGAFPFDGEIEKTPDLQPDETPTDESK